MSRVVELIDNHIDLDQYARYAAILGRNPSQGARSPLLWNAVFQEMGADAEMVPMDVSEENLSALLLALEQDLRFIGGAVAVPHKETTCAWVSAIDSGRVSPEAQAIGAVNCLYRDEHGGLCATNTDGEGALTCLVDVCGDLSGKHVLLMGPGGAGKAVAAYVAGAVGENGRVCLSAPSPQSISAFAARIDAEALPWPPEFGLAETMNIVINCTTIGTGVQTDYTPLADITDRNESTSVRWLRGLPRNAMVFDIIYDPAPSRLLLLARQQGYSTLDGGPMNLEQAVLAFDHAQGDNPGLEAIHSIMESAKTNDVAQ